MAYQINLTGQEIDERLQNIGTAEDVAAADGTLYARISKNADDIDELNDTVLHIQDAQTATDKTVTQHTADISTLQTAVGNNKTEQDAIAQKVEKNTTAIGNADDPNDAKGSLYARVKKANASTDVNRLAITTLSSANTKNQADIADVDSRQTNIEKVVEGARNEAYFSLRFLNLIVNSKFIADIDNIKVVLYRWSGKRYSVLELFTKNGIGESQKIIQYVIILKQTDVNGVNIRTPYIHYNDDATEETLENALKNAFGGRISYRKNKKKRWRLQAFLNGKPITAPFDFRVSIDCNDNYSLTKGGMMRSVPSSDSVVYDGLFNGSQWLRCKKGDLLDLSYSADAGILFPPTPGNMIGGDNNAKGCVVAVKNITQDASSVTVLWTVGDSFYEIGVEERVESDEYVYRCTSPAKKLCDDIYDYASKMNSGTLRDLYISAGAKYNETTGYYELNGLTDITEEEMRVIYNRWLIDIGTNGDASGWLTLNNGERTNLPCITRADIFQQLDNGISGSKVEVLRICAASTDDYTRVCYVGKTVAEAHQSMPKLRKVIGVWQYNSPIPTDFNFGYGQPFSNCPLLEEIRMKGINKSHTFAVSPNLSKESVLYMITNANPPSGAAAGSIAITLHPTAYARLKDDADIVAALEAKGGIVTLVSA